MTEISYINNKLLEMEIQSETYKSNPPQLKQRGLTELACLLTGQWDFLLAAFNHLKAQLIEISWALTFVDFFRKFLFLRNKKEISLLKG